MIKSKMKVTKKQNGETKNNIEDFAKTIQNQEINEINFKDDFENLDIKKIAYLIMKKALGYKSKEIIEEYQMSGDTGKLELNKKKITVKNIPPDLNAIQNLINILESNPDADLENMSDEELKFERQKLLNEICKNETIKGEKS